MPRLRSAALAVFLLSALVNLGLEQVDTAHRTFFLRGIPVWALCARLVATVPLPRSRLVLAALLLGSVGDIVLAARSETHGTALFLSGMGVFLVGHLCYITAFAREAELKTARWWPAGMFVAVGLVVSALLVRAMGAQAIPLIIYAGALLGMGVAAALRRSDHVTVVAGAALFILSDALIAVNNFLAPFPLAGVAILSTYWAAQFLISEGWAADQRTG